MKAGSLVQVGHTRRQDNKGWIKTSSNSRYPDLYGAILHVANNCMHIQHVAAARVGHGIRELQSLKGFSGSTVLLWKPGSSYPRVLELGSSGDVTGKLRIHLEHDDWAQLRVIQLLLSTES